MKIRAEVAVIIPVYRPIMYEDESRSLIQCIHVLHDRPIIFVCWEELNIDAYKNACKGKVEFKTEFFDRSFFKDIHGYSRLMLSVSFYKRFALYKYILIYQLDCWIFRDDLSQWCRKNFDYVGAPWIEWPFVSKIAEKLTLSRTILTAMGYKKYQLVGNGGFSLRKTKSCIFSLRLLTYPVSKFQFAEDYFFAFFINSYNPFFKIPNQDEALKFSFDINPEQSYRLNNNNLPMGCHAWPKFKIFWNKFI